MENDSKEPNKIDEALICLVKDYHKDEEFPRNVILREARRNNLYYANIQNLWLDSQTGDWRTFDSLGSLSQLPEGLDEDDLDFDYKIINVYAAYIDSIVAALSNQVPTTRFLPDDANKAEDVNTALAYSKVAEMLRRTNEAKLLLIQTLAILFNEGVAGIYNFSDKDEKYGIVSIPINGQFISGQQTSYCPDCQSELSSESFGPDIAEADAKDNSGLSIAEQEIQCPNCGYIVQPIIDRQESMSEGVVDYEQQPRLRIKQSVFGITNIRFPAHCMTQESIPVLTLEYDIDVALAKELYSDVADKIRPQIVDSASDNVWARQNPAYQASNPEHTCILRQCWIRPWAFNRLGDQYISEDGETKISNFLKQQYPKGLRVVIINENIVAEMHEENMDEHWTISVNPMYRQLICKAIGSRIIPIQDIENDMTNLTKQTVEHGIPQTFVESDLIDWDRYRKTEIKPGLVFPVKASGVRSINDSIAQTRTAALSQEVAKFQQSNEQRGQFVSGAFPSIYGGVMEGTNTAAEYSMSRAQALQRLMIAWASLCSMISKMELKSVKEYSANLNYDDHFVKSAGPGQFQNVYIKQIEMSGKVSNIEAEASENFPLTWAQKGDIFRQLMQAKNPYVDEVLIHPENRSRIADYVGAGELYIPGDLDRKKQLQEIYELCQSFPQGNMSSILPEPGTDDDYVHSETCKVWLLSMEGQQYKRDYPEQYLNVLLHKQLHDQALAMMQKSQMKEEKDKDNVEPVSQN